MRLFKTYLLPGVAYLLCARVTQLLSMDPAGVIPVWPAVGVGFAALLLTRYKAWPAIFIADALASHSSGISFGTSLMLAASNTVSMLAGAALLLTFVSTTRQLQSSRDTILFLLCGPIFTAASAALLGIWVMHYHGSLASAALLHHWWTWFIADLTGLVVVAPLVYSWATGPNELPPILRRLEGLGIVTATAATSWLVFSHTFENPAIYYPLTFTFVPAIAWATLRADVRTSTLLIGAVFIHASAATAGGSGPFVHLPGDIPLHILQIFISITALTTLFIQSITHERLEAVNAYELSQANLEAANRELEQRVARRTKHLEKTLKNLQQAEASYRTIFENAAEGIFQIRHNRIVRANQAIADLTGYEDPEQLKAEVGNVREHFVPDPQLREQLRDELIQNGQVINFELTTTKRNGETIWVSLSARALLDEKGELLGYEGIATNITNRKKTEERLHEQATRDPLTGVANRTLFDITFRKMLAQAARTNSGIGVLFLDFNNFKPINDKYGHATGDLVLRIAVDRIQKRLRDSDLLARVGGDEFAILLHDTASSSQARPLAENLLNTLTEPMQTDIVEIQLGISIGGSFYPRDGESAETLLDAADKAMYRAKKSETFSIAFSD